jgi:4a-hydroxytetrahydrobiopterin dehydratase
VDSSKSVLPKEKVMEKLCDMQCEACRLGAPLATDDEIVEYMAELSEWRLFECDGMNRVDRVFKFKNFAEAIAFTDKVGELAEQYGHHPTILTEWGKVTVTYWTHKIGGLHKTDFIMAAKTDALA